VAADIPGSATVVFRYRREFSPEIVGDLSMASVAAEEIEAAFAYSLGLVSESKKPNVVAAKATAYLHRGDVERAREVVETNPWKAPSLGQELEAVARLISERSGSA
jgi:thioredoxin-like negative regulator of GroEL